MSNLLNDSYDTMASLNYSLIPGIDARGDGRYSKDKDFQFAENSGGFLAVLMGGVATHVSIAKDIRAYKAATEDFRKNGLVDTEGKLSRLNTDILAKYFDKDLDESGGGFMKAQPATYHLIGAIRSLVGKKDENGKPLMTPEEATSMISHIQEAQSMYSSVADRIDNRIAYAGSHDIFENKAQFDLAKRMVKHDMFNAANDIVQRGENMGHYDANIENEATKFNSSFGHPDMLMRQKLSARVQALEELIHDHEQFQPKPGTADDVNVEKTNKILANHLVDLHSDLLDAKKALADEEGSYTNKDYVEHGGNLVDAYKEAITNGLFRQDKQRDYTKLDKIKNNHQLKDYYDDNQHRVATPDDNTIPVTDESKDNTVNTEDIPHAEETKEPHDTFTPDDVHNIPETDESQQDEVDDSTSEDADHPFTPENLSNHINENSDELNTEILKPILDEKSPLTTRAAELTKLMTSMPAVEGISPVQTMLHMLHAMNMSPKDIATTFPVLQHLLSLSDPSANNFTFDPRDLSLTEKGSIPPTQEGTFAEDSNRVFATKAIDERDGIGSGMKILDGLSIAGRHVEGNQDPNGQWRNDKGDDGLMKFSENVNQQLVNTSLISVGDNLTVRITKMPDNFNVDDASDNNYDGVEIGVFKTVRQGDTSQELLINYLHRLQKLPELLAERLSESEKQAEVDKLRAIRASIIKAGKDVTHVADVTQKGFGFLNTNRSTVKTIIRNAIGSDTRPRITLVENSAPLSQGRTVVSAYTYKGFVDGSTMLLIPNHVGNDIV